MESVKQIVEMGSFGALITMLAAMFWTAKALVPRIITRLDEHLAVMEGHQRDLNALLSSMRADNEAHYINDSHEQRAIDVRLGKILGVVEAEHETTRRVIIEAMRNA